MLNFEELKSFLDEKADQYNSFEFIENDPVQIPHRFSLKQDIEIAGFLAATISWGNRKSIIKSAEKMLDIMGNSPYDFVMNYSEKDLDSINDRSIHRTFNGQDFVYFIRQFNRIYKENDSLEHLFKIENPETNFFHAIGRFRNSFLEPEKHRSHKHVSSPYKNSSAKRIIMFLRWMVRKDNHGVDFGIWGDIDQKYLSIPLDVHTGNISRKLGLISRTQNDWKTVEELDAVIRKFDEKDPAKYDFALFGLGVTKELL
jgi:uncharacterized protein (TIGR02757 family)